jgi:hypothetical protein
MDHVLHATDYNFNTTAVETLPVANIETVPKL